MKRIDIEETDIEVITKGRDGYSKYMFSVAFNKNIVTGIVDINSKTISYKTLDGEAYEVESTISYDELIHNTMFIPVDGSSPVITSQKRYTVTIDLYIYQDDDNEAKKEAKLLTDMLNSRDDCKAEVLSIFETPFGATNKDHREVK